MRMRTMLKRKIKLICNWSTQWDGIGVCVCGQDAGGRRGGQGGVSGSQVWSARGPCPSPVGTACPPLLPAPLHPGSYQQDQDHGALVDVVSVHSWPFAKPAPRKPQRDGKGGGHLGPGQQHGEGQCLVRTGLGLEVRIWMPRFQPWEKVRIPPQCLSYSIFKMGRRHPLLGDESWKQAMWQGGGLVEMTTEWDRQGFSTPLLPWGPAGALARALSWCLSHRHLSRDDCHAANPQQQ